MIVLFIIGVVVVVAVLWTASAHVGTAVSLARTILYDAPLVVRELATRAGLWNRGLLDTMCIPRSTAEITADEWKRATGLIVMLHGYRAHRQQFNDYAAELRKRDPHLLLVIPDVLQGGNASLDTVLALLMRDIHWSRADIPVAWIGISNGARLAMHAIARHWTIAWPHTQAFLLAGPLRGTLRANWARDWLPLCIRRRFVCDAVLDEFILADTPLRASTSVRWHLFMAHYDYAISPTSSSIDLDDHDVHIKRWLYTGHTGMLARCQGSVLAAIKGGC
jgi:hypothetical protein